MRDLRGKVAFVTGGASGIGLALGEAFLREGMRVMLADIDAEALGAAAARLKGSGPDMRAVSCDVADPKSVDAAAEATIAAFGKVHVLCNNAGVGASGGSLDNIILEDWRWVLDVNLMGVVHGIRSFLRHLKAHGEGGHIVNTASIAGMINGGAGFSPYSVSKFGVVSLSEKLAIDLEPHNIGVSVLCPSYVRTHIVESARHRQPQYATAAERQPPPSPNPVVERIAAGMDPAVVASHVIAAIRDNELYILTHRSSRPPLEKRFERILAAFGRAEPGTE